MTKPNVKLRMNVRLLTGALFVALPLFVSAQSPRPMRVDDLFEIEELARDSGGSVALSPDGRAAAYTWNRPNKTTTNYNYLSPWANIDKDVWVQTTPSAKAINISQGVKDGTGWWGSVWSPDSNQLVLLSTRGGNSALWREGNAVVWSWDRKSNRLKQLSTRKVDRWLRQGRAFSWLDNRQVIVALLPAEAPSQWAELPQAQRIVLENWLKNSKGRETTAAVLDSGIPWEPNKQPHSQLMLLDVASGKSRVIVDDRAAHWDLAPGGKAIAYYRQTSAYAPTAQDKIQMNNRDGRFALQIVDLQGKPLFTNEASFADVVSKSLRWSADGNEFVFIGVVKAGEAPRIFRGSIATRQVAELKLGNLNASPPDQQQAQIRWTPTDQLLVLASQNEPADPSVKGRRDWWLIGADGSQLCLTKSLPAVPTELWPEEGKSSFVGLAKDEVWRVEASGQTRNLTEGFERKVDALAWPQTNTNVVAEVSKPDQGYSKIVLAAREPQQPFDYYVLDLASGAVKPLAKPDTDAELTNFSLASDSAIFYATGRKGTWVWRTVASSGQSQTLVQANTFLQGVAESEYRMIDYRSLNGKMLKGWILLPIGYKEGTRYPLLTWVYNGTEVAEKSNKPSASNRIGGAGIFNMQLATAQGFAVLLPSMPLAPDGGPDDPLLRLTDGVLPGVDKAIELGIADPDRLFVSGHSFGGFSTYGLITQTNRFKAAIAHNGIVNLINTYGVFTAGARYDFDSNDDLGYFIGWSEAGQGRMGNPPWKDQGRYIRNSPITYVDRVETPLLMLHSDLDICPIDDAENFFRSLYRQGKRVQYVRYWGEGHVLENPANIRDMWSRMVGWMDEYGDIERDAQGQIVFENGKAKGRAKPQEKKADAAPGA